MKTDDADRWTLLLMGAVLVVGLVIAVAAEMADRALGF